MRGLTPDDEVQALDFILSELFQAPLEREHYSLLSVLTLLFFH